jgi:hypothetical protein
MTSTPLDTALEAVRNMADDAEPANDFRSAALARRPCLLPVTRQFNCIVHHVLSVSDVPAWEYEQRMQR